MAGVRSSLPEHMRIWNTASRTNEGGLGRSRWCLSFLAWTLILYTGKINQGFPGPWLYLPLTALLTNALGTRGYLLGNREKSPVMRLQSSSLQWGSSRESRGEADLRVVLHHRKLPECITLAQVLWEEGTPQLLSWAAAVLTLVPESASWQRT